MLYSARARVKQIEGEFRVTFDGKLKGGQPYGVYNGHRVVATPHMHAVQAGHTWLVREILHWPAGTGKDSDREGKDRVQWGGLVYVWPVRRVG